MMNKLNNKKKLHISATEVFKEVKIEDGLQFRYAISNFGRLVSFTKNIKHGRVVNGSITDGYRIFRYKIFHDRKISYRHKFFYKLVAENFLEKTSNEQIYVLHLDHNLSNDLAENLKWATKQEMLDHQRTNPKVLKAREVSVRRIVEYAQKREGNKLKTHQVILIKELLAYPKRKILMKRIAKHFGISEMQLYRIKAGKNWGRIKINSQGSASKTEPAEELLDTNEKSISGKKVDLTQMSKKELIRQQVDEAWNEKLEAFLNGEKGEIIRRWIDSNRRQYRKGRLSAEKFEKLIEANFPFEATSVQKVFSGWNRDLAGLAQNPNKDLIKRQIEVVWNEKLEAFRKGEKSELLRRWIDSNRRQYRKGSLPADRLQKLMEVNFPFEAATKNKAVSGSGWDRNLEEWKKGNRKGKIQQWKKRNIRQFIAGKLSENRIEKLKGIGILK